MRVFKEIQLAGFTGRFTGISEKEFYFNAYIVDNSEGEFSDICAAILSPGSVAIDIGANIGMKTFIMSKLVESGSSDDAAAGKVISIEGSPTATDILKSNVAENSLSNVIVENVACSDNSGIVGFCDNSAWGYIDRTGMDCFTVDETGQISMSPSLESKKVFVKAVTLDELAATFGLNRLDFIKIDTEGHELSILKGGENIIRKLEPYIYTEFLSFGLSVYGDTNPKDFINYLYENFRYVFQVKKRKGKGYLLPVEYTKRLQLLYDNMMKNNSVDDLVVTNRSTAMTDLGSLLWNSSIT